MDIRTSHNIFTIKEKNNQLVFIKYAYICTMYINTGKM